MQQHSREGQNEQEICAAFPPGRAAALPSCSWGSGCSERCWAWKHLKIPGRAREGWGPRFCTLLPKLEPCEHIGLKATDFTHPVRGDNQKHICTEMDKIIDNCTSVPENRKTILSCDVGQTHTSNKYYPILSFLFSFQVIREKNQHNFPC